MLLLLASHSFLCYNSRMTKSLERGALFGRWSLMLGRCMDPKHPSYSRYGGRGIKVEPEWLDYYAYENWFVSQPNWNLDLQVDRINNDGNYCPENCRLVTPAENSRNKSSNVWLEAFGERKIITDWPNDDRCIVDKLLLQHRVTKYGWNHEKAITTPPQDFASRIFHAFGEGKTLTEWIADPRCVVDKPTISVRTTRDNWSFEDAISTPENATRSAPRPHFSNDQTAFGETKTASEWVQDSRAVCKDVKAIWQRMNQDDWSFERALTTPLRVTRPRASKRMETLWGETKTVTEWLADPRAGVTEMKFIHERAKRGWDFEKCLTTPRMR